MVLHHLGRLTSLDLLRCNPDCALFYPASTPAVQPAASPGMLHPPRRPTQDVMTQRMTVPEHLKCTSLRQLRLSHLVQSSSDSIMKFLSRFPNLMCVELMYCEQMTSAALTPLASVRTLQRLSLVACPRVDKNLIPRAARFPALQEIHLKGCVQATDALLQHLAGTSSCQAQFLYLSLLRAVLPFLLLFLSSLS